MNMIEFEELRNRCNYEQNSFLERLYNINNTIITVSDKPIEPNYSGQLLILNNILNIEKENN